MNKQEHFKFHRGVIVYPLFIVLIIWSVFSFEIQYGVNLNTYGIYPQTIKGMRGIVLSPFIHGSLQHIYHNTIPLFVLTMALFYFYRPIAWKVIVYGVLLSGFLTWCIGRPSYHVGVSGLIYVLVSFIFFKGVFTKYYRLIALSLLVIFLYGSLIWYVFPMEENISWEGHLSGLITGFVFALAFKKNIAKPKKYSWEQEHYNENDDPFLKHFDAEGNFMENEKPTVEQEQTIVNYTVKERKSPKE